MVTAAEVFVVAVAALLLVLVLTSPVGCTAFDGSAVEVQQEVSTAADVALSDAKADWQERYNLAVATGDHAGADKASAALDFYSDLEARKSEFDADTNKILGRVTNEDGTVNPEKAATEAAIMLLPAPWSYLATLAVPGLGLLVREFQNSKAKSAANKRVRDSIKMSQEIIASVDAARKANPAVADGMAETATKAAMWEQLSPETYQFIDTWRNT
jgi:hypothetical protein